VSITALIPREADQREATIPNDILRGPLVAIISPKVRTIRSKAGGGKNRPRNEEREKQGAAPVRVPEHA